MIESETLKLTLQATKNLMDFDNYGYSLKMESSITKILQEDGYINDMTTEYKMIMKDNEINMYDLPSMLIIIARSKLEMNKILMQNSGDVSVTFDVKKLKYLIYSVLMYIILQESKNDKKGIILDLEKKYICLF